MATTLGIAVLAAGKGTRLKLNGSKVLAPLLGRALVDFPLEAARSFLQTTQMKGAIGVITGHEREQVESYITTRSKHSEVPLSFAYQKEQLGTAHALQTYFAQIKGATEHEFTLVLCGDTPLIRQNELSFLYDKIKATKLSAVVATYEPPCPHGYGRIIRSKTGLQIIEEKCLTEEQRKVREVNSGLYIFRTSYLVERLKKVSLNSVSKEYYLTDVFQPEDHVQAVLFDNWMRFNGVNTLAQLEEAAQGVQKDKLQALRNQGVLFLKADSVSIDYDVTIEQGCVIGPNVVIQGASYIGKNALIEVGAIIKNSSIEEGAKIFAYSYLEEAKVQSKAHIGPFARLRPGSDIGEEAKVGNFVETKKAKLHQGVKVSHLSYVGDAEIGQDSNIGCGFITCNYDGEKKHFSKIGKNTFIGSDCQVVAPITIGDNAFVACGSSITQDIPDGAFAVARTKQVNKEGQAKRFLKTKKQDSPT